MIRYLIKSSCCSRYENFDRSRTSRLFSRAPGRRHPLARAAQAPLFCACGRATPAIAGLCRVCYRARAHSRAYFAGNREEVLDRDRGQCRGCGAGNGGRRLHVHHREPGNPAPASLIALCAACHARVHRLGALRVWLPESLVELWAEQHPAVPLQLQFPLGAFRKGREAVSSFPVIPAPPSSGSSPVWGWVRVRALVLNSLPSPHSKRVYGKALDDFWDWSRANGKRWLYPRNRPALPDASGGPGAGRFFRQSPPHRHPQTGAGRRGAWPAARRRRCRHYRDPGHSPERRPPRHLAHARPGPCPIASARRQQPARAA